MTRLFRPGHTYTTHGQRTKKNHSFWPVRCPSLDVRQHSLLVRWARWAYGIYSLSFAVCVELFVHAQNCALSSTHECTRQKDARHARSALDQRQIHAERSLGIRFMFVGWGVASSEHPAHTWRTSSARVANMYRLYVGILNDCWTSLQRAQRPSNVRDESWAHNDALTFYNAPAVRHVGVTKLCEILMKVGRTTTHWRFAMRRPCVM